MKVQLVELKTPYSRDWKSEITDYSQRVASYPNSSESYKQLTKLIKEGPKTYPGKVNAYGKNQTFEIKLKDTHIFHNQIQGISSQKEEFKIDSKKENNNYNISYVLTTPYFFGNAKIKDIKVKINEELQVTPSQINFPKEPTSLDKVIESVKHIFLIPNRD